MTLEDWLPIIKLGSGIIGIILVIFGLISNDIWSIIIGLVCLINAK